MEDEDAVVDGCDEVVVEVEAEVVGLTVTVDNRNELGDELALGPELPGAVFEKLGSKVGDIADTGAVLDEVA